MEKKKKSWARGEITLKRFFRLGKLSSPSPERRDGNDFGFLYLVPLLYFSQLRANNNRKKEIREKECWKVRQQAMKKNKTLRSKSLEKLK